MCAKYICVCSVCADVCSMCAAEYPCVQKFKAVVFNVLQKCVQLCAYVCSDFYARACARNF